MLKLMSLDPSKEREQLRAWVLDDDDDDESTEESPSDTSPPWVTKASGDDHMIIFVEEGYGNGVFPLELLSDICEISKSHMGKNPDVIQKLTDRINIFYH